MRGSYFSALQLAEGCTVLSQRDFRFRRSYISCSVAEITRNTYPLCIPKFVGHVAITRLVSRPQSASTYCVTTVIRQSAKEQRTIGQSDSFRNHYDHIHERELRLNPTVSRP